MVSKFTFTLIAKIFAIYLLFSINYHCSSSQDFQKKHAYENPLTNVCPDFGTLNPNDEKIKNNIHYNNSEKYPPLLAIKLSTNNIKSVSLSDATAANSLVDKNSLIFFKSQFKEICPSENLPKWFIDKENKFIKESIISCSGNANNDRCFKEIALYHEHEPFDVYNEVLESSLLKPVDNIVILDYLLSKVKNDKDLSFKYNLQKAANLILVEEKKSNAYKVENVIKILKISEDLDFAEFQKSINFPLYSQIVKKHEELKLSNSNIPKLDEEISSKKKTSGSCTYMAFGEFQKMVGTNHVFYGTAYWRDGALCENQKIQFKNNFAGLVNNDFFAIANVDRKDYISPSTVKIEKAYLSQEITLTNGIKMFVFTKTPPVGLAAKEAEIDRLIDKRNSLVASINLEWENLAKDLKKITIKLPKS